MIDFLDKHFVEILAFAGGAFAGLTAFLVNWFKEQNKQKLKEFETENKPLIDTFTKQIADNTAFYEKQRQTDLELYKSNHLENVKKIEKLEHKVEKLETENRKFKAENLELKRQVQENLRLIKSKVLKD